MKNKAETTSRIRVFPDIIFDGIIVGIAVCTTDVIFTVLIFDGIIVGIAVGTTIDVIFTVPIFDGIIVGIAVGTTDVMFTVPIFDGIIVGIAVGTTDFASNVPSIMIMVRFSKCDRLDAMFIHKSSVEGKVAEVAAVNESPLLIF